MIERAALFGEARTLVGVVTLPEGGAARTAVVFLNAGVVHRVGPNRIHVTAARQLAAEGFLSARVDLSGLGDSDARRDSLPFEQAAVMEVREVMTALQREHGVSRFVLAGLCSGAVVAFRGALADDRVVGAVLINPQGFVQSAEWQTHVVAQAQARNVLTKKVFRLESWRRALTGRSHYRHLLRMVTRRAATALREDAAVSQIAQGLSSEFQRLRDRGVRLMLACSEGDLGIDYLNVILGDGFDRLRATSMHTVLLPPGDHSLTLAETQDRFFSALREWAKGCVDAGLPAVAFTPSALDALTTSARASLRS
jgi:pimeloyl-ACP methyl ester carboxylesterase